MEETDRREFLTITGASVASIAVAGCLGGNGGDGGNESNGSTGANESNESTGYEATDSPSFDLDGAVGETPEFLEITSFNAYAMIENVGVMGVAENVGDDPLDDIEIEVTLNDDDTVIGEFIDTSTEDIDYLRPDNDWRFDVVFRPNATPVRGPLIVLISALTTNGVRSRDRHFFLVHAPVMDHGRF